MESEWVENPPSFKNKSIEDLKKEIDQLLDEYNDHMCLYELFNDNEYKELALFTKQAFMRKSKFLSTIEQRYKL